MVKNKLLDYISDQDHYADGPIGNPNYRSSSAIIHETMNSFWGDLDHHADSPDSESGKYVCNDRPCLCSLSAYTVSYCKDVLLCL